MKRRKLVLLLGSGWFGTWLPGLLTVLTGCTTQVAENTQDKNTKDNQQGFKWFVSLAVLDEAGMVLRDNFAKDPILLVRDPKDTNVTHAVAAQCTHQGCLVNWKREQSAFVCPCHGSTFGLDGKVIQGPAKRDLPTLASKIEGSDVLVQAE
jgi:cytochrome b6-f complex iron-sulfur subunit